MVDADTEQNKLAFAAAAAWAYFIANGRSVLVDAVPKSQHGAQLLMQNRTGTILDSSATASSGASSSSGAGASNETEVAALPPGSPGIANQSKTPPAPEQALSRRPPRRSASASASAASAAAAAAAASSQQEELQRNFLPSGIVTIVAPPAPADETENSGSFFEVTDNNKGWVHLLNAATRAKILNSYRQTAHV